MGFRNVRNPIGVYPAHRAARAQQTLDRLGIPFTYLGSVAEAALHNPNMIVHPVGAVMSIAGMERAGGDFCMYHETFTPAVWRLLEALDGEKMDVLAALGLPRVSYAQACRFRNTLDDGADGKEVFMRYAAMPERAKGPLSLEDRYFTEDIPQGLVLLESLGAYCGAATPVAASLIGIASACLGRDLREDARTVDRLGRCEMERLLSSDSTKAE